MGDRSAHPPASRPAIAGSAGGLEPGRAGRVATAVGLERRVGRRLERSRFAQPCPVVLLAMIPPLQFRAGSGCRLVLATPVVAWGAWPFHRAAPGQPASRRQPPWTPDQRRCARPSAGRCTRWSSAGVARSRCPSLLPAAGAHGDLPRGGRHGDDVPAGRTLFRGASEGPRRFGSAGLLKLGAKDVAVLRDGVEVPGRRLVRCGLGTGSSSGPASRSPTDGVVETGTTRSTPACSPARAYRSR